MITEGFNATSASHPRHKGAGVWLGALMTVLAAAAPAGAVELELVDAWSDTLPAATTAWLIRSISRLT